MEAILEHSETVNSANNRSEAVFGKKIGLAAKFFGCRHKRLSRPFSDVSSAYRTCLECGARKAFDSETLKTSGSFYYPPATLSEATWAITKKPR